MWPTLFHIHHFPVSLYGIMLAVALLVGTAVAVWRGRRAGVKDDVILDATFYGVIAGFAGGRVGFILTHLDAFAADPLGILLDRAGFQFLGGLIAALATGAWIARRRGQPILNLADVATPSIALGHFFGRLGCFFAGCCYGRVCPDGFEAVGLRFPRLFDPEGRPVGSYAVYDHIDAGLLPPDAQASLPVWPTQLMEAGGNLAIFLLLTWLWRRRRFEGQIFAAYLSLYAVLRFTVEFFRGDMDRGFVLGLSTSQWLSLAAVGVAAWLWWFARNREAAPAVAEGGAGDDGGAGGGTDGEEGNKRKKRKRGGRG